MNCFEFFVIYHARGRGEEAREIEFHKTYLYSFDNRNLIRGFSYLCFRLVPTCSNFDHFATKVSYSSVIFHKKNMVLLEFQGRIGIKLVYKNGNVHFNSLRWRILQKGRKLIKNKENFRKIEKFLRGIKIYFWGISSIFEKCFPGLEMFLHFGEENFYSAVTKFLLKIL